MSKEDELREVLDNTAKEMAQLDRNPRAWLSWMVYLLGAMEQQATDYDPSRKDSYKEMLAAIQDAIRNRLRTGGW
jgi:hypothetical protein